MNPERWQKIKIILEEAIKITPESRAAFLEKNCKGDKTLQREIESLLEFEDENADFLEQNAFSVVLENGAAGKNQIGKQIGHYKIVDELGAGGMGAVFLAERADGEFMQKVALKLIKRGMDSDAVLRHFLNERQILASLEHPNIAHLVDGGTTDDGLPFFVMEYVEGVSIIEFAARENLDLEARLSLFREVCAAVSFAHQNLVIHRDLKPSNILITKDGKAKLLDFGIAKLLKSDDTNQTATQMRVFTPEYASPEQIRGEKLTTATDIYSLSVILYELLTGNRPYKTDSQNISDIIKAVCETEPVRPSSVVSRPLPREKDTNPNQPETNQKSKIKNQKSLKGDLDNIILKALRKEPERRYSSVEQFSEDIRRHLVGLPVTASRDTWNYRASKFIRRNKIGVAAAALILVTLLGGLFATLYQRNKAQKRFNDVRQLANSFLFEFHDSIANLPGATPARELVVKRALEYLDNLAQEAEGDDTLQRELATAYEKIGKIQGNSYYSNLGDTEGATKSYQTSLEIREKLIKRDPNNRELQHELANSYEGVADMLYIDNKLEKGLENYQKSFRLNETVYRAEPQNLKYVKHLAESYRRIGDVTGLEGYANLGDTNGAVENYRNAVRLGEKLIAAEPENPAYLASFATWTINLALLESTTGDNKNAIVNGQKAIAIFEKINAANPNNEHHKLNMLSAFNVIRFPLVEEMRFDEATENMNRTIKMLEEMSSADPKNKFMRRSLGVSYNALGRTKTDANDAKAAIENHQKTLKIVEELIQADPQNSEHQRDLAMTLEFMANAQTKAGDCGAALTNYRKSLELSEKQSTPSENLIGVYTGIGKCLAANGDLPEAAKTFRQAIPSVEKVAQKSPLNVRKQVRVAIYYFEGGKVLAQFSPKLSGEAKEWLEKSAKIFNDLKLNGNLGNLYEHFPAEIEQELKKFKI